jgi:ubiquinone/menaquinone biosynthesis C-methylase UbiE
LWLRLPPRPASHHLLLEVFQMSMYRHDAGLYNLATQMFNELRRRAVELLRLRPGSTVIDVGCGTGLSFPYLQDAIGPTGRVIAIEQSAAMLAEATHAADRHGWRNITFLHHAAQDAAIPSEADAALFCAVHDILRSSTAVKNVLAHVKPGGRVVAVGGKWPPAPFWPLHALVAVTHAPYVTTFEGFERPWSLLIEHCANLSIQPVAFGTGYLAAGSLPDR